MRIGADGGGSIRYLEYCISPERTGIFVKVSMGKMRSIVQFCSASQRCVKLLFCSRAEVSQDTRLPERGTSGSVQRGPANPARPGREQRYRERLGCRRSPEVPRTEMFHELVVRRPQKLHTL